MHLSPAISIMPQTGRLRRFLLLSLALHAVALLLTAMAMSPRPALPALSLGHPTLHVRLDTRVRQNVSRSPAHATRDADAPAPAAGQAQTSDPAPTAVSTGNDTHATGHAALQNYLLGTLNSELARYLTYPHLARARGWQGTVLVGLDIAPGGLLSNMRLIKSSGFSLLDQASLAGLRRIRALPVAAAYRWSGPVEVILPIRFHLTDKS